MNNIILSIVLAVVLVSFLPVAVLLWKMAIDELFGNDRRKELDRLIERQIADINKLAEDLK